MTLYRGKTSTRITRLLVAGLVLIPCLVPLVGCGSGGRIDTVYGRRRGASGGASVNGTAVLSGMFEAAGHRVTSWRRLSPRIEDFDVLVWTPDSFLPPDEETREYLEEWLRDKPNRTLIYVGRDYDAATEYWRTIQPSVPPEQTMEVGRRLAEAQAEHAERRGDMPQEQYARWFVVRRGGARQRVTTLNSPVGDWAEGIDASRAEMVYQGTLDPATRSDVPRSRLSDLPRSEVLLAAGDQALVTRVTERGWQGSQILVVANGSFLLNLALVNHEHRKLASRLIEACGPPREVALLESGRDGLPIYDQEPDASYPTGAEVFTVWPLGLIALHLVALGIVFCFAEFPIFGRPRSVFVLPLPLASGGAMFTILNIEIVAGAREEPRSQSDFGEHIRAFGALLQRTGDVSYARARLQHYQQYVRKESSNTPPPSRETSGARAAVTMSEPQ